MKTIFVVGYRDFPHGDYQCVWFDNGENALDEFRRIDHNPNPYLVTMRVPLRWTEVQVTDFVDHNADYLAERFVAQTNKFVETW